MRSGMQSLLRLLHGHAKIDQLPETEWLTVLDLAQEENILPWTAAALRAQRGSDEGPMPQLAARLDQIHRTAQISSFLWTSTLKSVLAEFHRRSIPVISLKGPWLAERICGDAALKLYADLDLLVRREDIQRAENALTEMSYLPIRRRDDYSRTWRRDSVKIDLHHDVENPLAFDFNINAAWDRAVPAEFHGVSALILDPCDELVFLCFHAARHRFGRLSYAFELARAFRCLGAPAASAAIKRSPLSDRIVAFGRMMAAHFDPQVALSDEALNSVPSRQTLQKLADSLWQEQLSQSAPVLDWSRKHQFFVEIEAPGRNRFRARLRHLRILLTRLIEADFAFAQRFNLHRTWQVWMLRPLRLLLGERTFWARDRRWEPSHLCQQGSPATRL